jgi:hypothetical protein
MPEPSIVEETSDGKLTSLRLTSVKIAREISHGSLDWGSFPRANGPRAGARIGLLRVISRLTASSAFLLCRISDAEESHISRVKKQEGVKGACNLGRSVFFTALRAARSGFSSVADLVALQACSPLHLLLFLLLLTLQPPCLDLLGEGENIISLRILAVAFNHGSDARIL